MKASCALRRGQAADEDVECLMSWHPGVAALACETRGFGAYRLLHIHLVKPRSTFTSNLYNCSRETDAFRVLYLNISTPTAGHRHSHGFLDLEHVSLYWNALLCHWPITCSFIVIGTLYMEEESRYALLHISPLMQVGSPIALQSYSNGLGDPLA